MGLFRAAAASIVEAAVVMAAGGIVRCGVVEASEAVHWQKSSNERRRLLGKRDSDVCVTRESDVCDTFGANFKVV